MWFNNQNLGAVRVTRVGEGERGRSEVKLTWQARLPDTEAGAYLNCPLIDSSSTFLLTRGVSSIQEQQ